MPRLPTIFERFCCVFEFLDCKILDVEVVGYYCFWVRTNATYIFIHKNIKKDVFTFLDMLECRSAFNSGAEFFVKTRVRMVFYESSENRFGGPKVFETIPFPLEKILDPLLIVRDYAHFQGVMEINTSEFQLNRQTKWAEIDHKDYC